MSAGTHTPAPWSVEPMVDYGFQITVPGSLGAGTFNKTAVACAYDLWERDGGKATATANARLIAAAPDLKEFADNILIYQIEGDDNIYLRIPNQPAICFTMGSKEAIVLLALEAQRRAAIAKATGAA